MGISERSKGVGMGQSRVEEVSASNQSYNCVLNDNDDVLFRQIHNLFYTIVYIFH